MVRIDLVVAPTITEAVRWVGDHVLGAYKDVTAAGSPFSIALAGGGTPRSLYELLSSPLWRARCDWGKIHVYLGDERYVPHTDPRSNYRMIRETLLDRVLIPPRNVNPVPTASDIDSDAAAYAAVLDSNLPKTDAGAPQFDLVLLGLGPDGHTASLFPGSAALEVTDRWAVGVEPPNAPTPRISLTLPVLNSARDVVILTAGTLKAGALSHLLAKEGDTSEIPARGLAPEGRFLIVTDLEACERLDTLPLRDGIVTTRVT